MDTMGESSYRIVHFTEATWREFLGADGKVMGFRRTQRARLKSVKPGDRLLCYVVRLSCFVGVLEVVSEPFDDSTPIWSDDEFPCRVRVKTLIAVRPDAGIRIHEFQGRLSIFTGRPTSWVGHIRGPLIEWSPSDAHAVISELSKKGERRVSRG